MLKYRLSINEVFQKTGIPGLLLRNGVAEAITIITTTLESASFDAILVIAALVIADALVSACNLRLKITKPVGIFEFAILVPADGHTVAILLVITAGATLLLKTFIAALLCTFIDIRRGNVRCK